ncbi:hypothetical protein QE152_g9805 [Popillia japonica]|uniref:Endonuclease/exonuclease/phosphatase domain-containing protein n=1 Tax=Popillia japonica TaxID=7064 RepID=A0AAW1LXJ2_POPJA
MKDASQKVTKTKFCRQIYKHGGSAIVLSNNIVSRELSEIAQLSIERNIEMSAIAIESQKNVIVSLYRPPTGEMEVFMDRLRQALLIITSKYSTFDIVVAGDYNINFMTTSKYRDNVIDLFKSFGLDMVFSEPSRKCRMSESCIDNIFLTNNWAEKLTVNPHISDHYGQVIKIELRHTQNNVKRVQKVRKTNEFNSCLLRNELSQINWDPYINHISIQNAFWAFHDVFYDAPDMIMPETEVTTRQVKKQYPITWYTEELQQMNNLLNAVAIISEAILDDILKRFTIQLEVITNRRLLL